MTRPPPSPELGDTADRAELLAQLAEALAFIHSRGLVHGDVKAENVLDQRYLELALVTVSKLNECTYCVSHHTPNLAITGVSEQAALNILDYDNQPEFDEVDRLVIEYAIEVTQRWNYVRDGMFERLREHFTDEQITELTWRISLCGAFNRFNDVLQLGVEDGVDVLAQGAEDAA